MSCTLYSASGSVVAKQGNRACKICQLLPWSESTDGAKGAFLLELIVSLLWA